MNDIEKRAREILVDALVRHHCIVTAATVLRGGEVYGPGYEPNMRAALDAVIAALSAAPQVPEGMILIQRKDAERLVKCDNSPASSLSRARVKSMLAANPEPQA